MLAGSSCNGGKAKQGDTDAREKSMRKSERKLGDYQPIKPGRILYCHRCELVSAAVKTSSDVAAGVGAHADCCIQSVGTAARHSCS